MNGFQVLPRLVSQPLALALRSFPVVVITGSRQTGKSTLVNLCLRFFDPERGKVLIDGQDIRHVTIASLREAIALVTQDPVLGYAYVSRSAAQGLEPAKSTLAQMDEIMPVEHEYEADVDLLRLASELVIEKTPRSCSTSSAAMVS